MQLNVKDIRTDGGTQMRVQPFQQAVLDEYAETITEGGSLPPLTVFHDGAAYWLADGFHRIHAYQKAGVEMVEADVRDGTQRDAILYAVGANASHGLRRTNADKRKAVETLLRDEEWRKWSDREIGRRAGVSNRFVSNLRSEVSVNGSQIEERLVQRGGTTFSQDVSNIGQRPQSNEAAQRLAANMARNLSETPSQPTPARMPPAPTSPQPQQQRTLPPSHYAGLPPEALNAKDMTDEEIEREARAEGWRPPEPGAPSLSDPVVSNRADTLRKALDQLLRFQKDGRDVLDTPGAQMLNLELLVFYAHEMLGEWLQDTSARTADEQARTINAESLN